MVLKLKKSLNGLKQSGRNWNKLLHDDLIGAGFARLRNPADHCVYHIGEKVIILVWVDDV